MTRRTAALIVVVVLAVAGIAVAGFLATHGGSGVKGGARELFVRRSVSPESQKFGDPVVATLVVLADARRVDPRSIAVDATFAPYDVVGKPVVTRSQAGQLIRLRATYHLQCLSSDCVPAGLAQVVRLPVAHVTYGRTSGEPGVPRAVAWPHLTIASELENGKVAVSDQSLGFGPILRARTPSPDAPSYRISPWVALVVLLGGAAALVAVAGALLAPLARRRAAVEPELVPSGPELTPLERALVGLDWAREHGGTTEQRKALELLSEELDADGAAGLDVIADEARVLAWSARPPGDEPIALLSDRVRVVLDERAATAREEELEAETLVGVGASAPEENGRGA